MRAFAVIVFLAAISGSLLAQSRHQADRQWQAPPEAATRTNPLADRPEVALGGRKVFLRECAQCHGEQGLGGKRKRAPALTTSEVQAQSDGALFWKITNGNPRRGMPSWSRLPEGMRWQLVLFLRTLNHKSALP
jgi:mono/diheme cytochrome c family protein